MALSRTVKTGTCTSRVIINYKAAFVAEDRIQVTLDTGTDTGLCRLRIYSPDGTVISERVVRSIPATIELAQQPMTVREEAGSVLQVPASITVFRIRDNGTLEFSKTYDVDTSGGRSLWWVGMASLRGST